MGGDKIKSKWSWGDKILACYETCGWNLWIPRLLELPLPSCLQLLQSSNSQLKSAWHPHKVLAISAVSGAKRWPLCSHLTGMTKHLARIGCNHWHLDLTKAEWLLSCYTRKERHFFHWISSAIAQNSSYKAPFTKKYTEPLCWNIKILNIGRQVKIIYVLFSVIYHQYFASLCFPGFNSNFFFIKFMKHLWGTDPKVHRFGDKESLIPFLKNSKKNIWKCIKDNS